MFSMIEEQWRPLRGYRSEYQISNHGRVKRLSRTIICKNGMPKPLPERILTPQFNSNGYLWHQFPGKIKKDFRFVHRMVAEAFVENPQSKPFVNHKSGIKTENDASNLEWVTRQENISHAFDTGLMSHAGEKNSQSKLTRAAVILIRKDRVSGMRVIDIAIKHRISRRRVYDVVNNRCWNAAA